jgi:hypothetical protein
MRGIRFERIPLRSVEENGRAWVWGSTPRGGTAVANRISSAGIPDTMLVFALRSRKPARAARVWPATSW